VWVVLRLGRLGTACAHGACQAWSCGPSTSPLAAMTDTRLALRCCVIGAFVLLAVGGAFDLLVPGSLLRNADQTYGTGFGFPRISMWMFGFGALVGLAFIVGGLGLLALKPWSRPLALWSTILGAAVYPFYQQGDCPLRLVNGVLSSR
jgi:hypothetical protein